MALKKMVNGKMANVVNGLKIKKNELIFTILN